MRVLPVIVLANIIAGAYAFAPTRIAREPSSFVIRLEDTSKVKVPASLHVAASDVASVGSASTPVDPMRQLKVGYKWTSKRNYLTLAFVQATILASGADILTQTMESGTVDISHVAAMATIASTMSGVFNAVCLRQLEDQFPGKSKSNVVIKTLIHATIIASIINSAYLAGVPLLADHIYQWTGLPTDPLSAWQLPEFITLTKLEVAMFIPYNTLAFAFVPPQVRPLTHAAISATFNVAVSAVTLGYFDDWCSRAMDMLG